MAKLRASGSSLRSLTSKMRRSANIRKLPSARVLLLFFISLASAQAQIFTSLHSFDGADGALPWGSLVEGTDGNLYGTTSSGGVYGAGTVFKVSPEGKLMTLHTFDYDTDGAGPFAGLTRGRTGNFYGVTVGGSPHSEGTIFEITPEGKLTTLYNFCSEPNCDDGANPYAGLVEGSDGSLYGTTFGGGAASFGTIFKFSRDGKLSTLHDFCSDPNCADGTAPLYGSLLRANGRLYGTTPMGGTHGMGTVFEITADGTFTTLYNFCSQENCADGANPSGGLVRGLDGNFYGTTSSGGSTPYGGTVFEITAKGKLITIFSFASMSESSIAPDDGLIESKNGNFYGTAYAGGASIYGNGGTVFEITPQGGLTTLYTFCSQPGCIDGRAPVAGLTEARSGIFYGTTALGGLNSTIQCGLEGEYSGCGTLFRLDLDAGANLISAKPMEDDGP
jgi:uncharacterized repeat protein (TIGR03803 family)